MQIALRCEQKMFEIIELLSRVFPRSLHNEIVDRIKNQIATRPNYLVEYDVRH